MAQTDERYYATYCRLDVVSDDRDTVVGINSVVIGTELSIEREDYVNERGKEVCRAVVSNSQNEVVGFLPSNCARRVCDLISSDWVVRLAAWGLVYNSTEKKYYVEAGLIAYEPQFENLASFADGCFKRMAGGERPDLKLGDKMLDAAMSDKNFYKTVRNIGHPKSKKDEAFYKTGRTAAETMAAEGAKGNPGCWVGTVFFYAALIAIIGAIVWFFFLK